MFENLSPDMVIRLYAFSIVLGALVLWELLAPRRLNILRKLRWPSNFGIFLINSVLLVVIPASALGASLLSLEYKFGLFIWFKASLWPSIILTLLILDAAIYWQHRLFHRFGLLWRIHRMHHTDTEFDVTTALRFHPIEILLSILIKGAVIILLGAPILAVIGFEIILNSAAMFNHSNVRIPRWLDKYLRYIVVTPDMHRVHHSVYKDEHDFNYGFCLSWWDRLFGSYVSQPKDGHCGMTIGLEIFNQKEDARLDKLLTQPFRSQ
ncbi:sterol desaturase family protein [Candidatus Spongiihabitans sp.]|uniref:sterol desaturase family protein n=1 Tax=Candidatus Spongiihabitans sp. TaxID=3101308 RepID=UPI003C6F59B5